MNKDKVNEIIVLIRKPKLSQKFHFIKKEGYFILIILPCKT